MELSSIGPFLLGLSLVEASSKKDGQAWLDLCLVQPFVWLHALGRSGIGLYEKEFHPRGTREQECYRINRRVHSLTLFYNFWVRQVNFYQWNLNLRARYELIRCRNSLLPDVFVLCQLERPFQDCTTLLNLILEEREGPKEGGEPKSIGSRWMSESIGGDRESPLYRLASLASLLMSAFHIDILYTFFMYFACLLALNSYILILLLVKVCVCAD